MIRFAELFCGIGGFRFGLEKASNLSNSNSHAKGETDKEEEYSIGKRYNSLERNGTSREERTTNSRTIDKCAERQSYRCVWANDNDKYACQIYRKHYGTKELVEGDIRQINPDNIPDFDLLTAGFPCQSFSLAGKRKGFQDIRGTLFYEVVRVARIKRPLLLLLENVKGLLSNDNGKTFATILEELGRIGYWVEWQTLNSKHYGVPQNRERVFIVGHLRGSGTRQIFPVGQTDEGTVEPCGKAQGIGSRFRVANTLNCSGSGKERNLIERKIRIHRDDEKKSEIQGYSFFPETANYVDVVDNHPKNILVANTLSHRYGKDGSENLIQVQPCLTPDRANKRQNGRRFKENGEPAFTLTGQDVHGIVISNAVDCDGYLRSGARPRDENGKPQLLPIGYRRIRRLTPTECERLQGFPDGWTSSVSDTQRYKLLGNAVTTNVITFLGQKLQESNIGKGVGCVTAYNCWRCGRVYNSDYHKRCPLCGADLKEPEKKC